MATEAATVPENINLSPEPEIGNGVQSNNTISPTLAEAPPPPVLTDEQIDDTVLTEVLPVSESVLKKWFSYGVQCVMLFSALAVIIAGMASKQEVGWGLAFIVCYVCWMLAASICLGLNIAKPGLLIKRSVSHLACCALTLYFFAAALHISSTDLPMYIPICINLGLLLSIGLQQISLPTKMRLLSYLGLGYYEIVQQTPILPLVQPRIHIPRHGVEETA